MAAPYRLFRHVNGKQDVEKLNGDELLLHGPKKALFYNLLHLIRPPPEEWLDGLTGNRAVIADIYKEYLNHEKQGWRRENLTRIVPFTLANLEMDINYREVFDWFLFRICQEMDAGNILFRADHTNPVSWYQDSKGRIPERIDIIPGPQETGYTPPFVCPRCHVFYDVLPMFGICPHCGSQAIPYVPIQTGDEK